MANKKWIFKNRYLLPITIILVIVLTYAWITNEGVIVFYGDSLKQQIPFYSGMWEKVHSGNLGFWDWSMIFGTNSFAQTFYCYLNNPYLYIILMFPKEWIPQIYTLTNLLKLLLTYISAFWWLTKIKRSEVSAISGALIVSFSAWFLTMYEWGHLLDVFPLYFVVLILVDDFILKGKRNLLIVTIAIMIIINYYLSYMFLPFIMIYACYRLYVLLDIISIKIYTAKLIKLFGMILLSVMVSGFILLPSAYIVLKTPRIMDSQSPVIYGFSIIYRIITSIFLPAAYHTQPNILTSALGIGWYGGISLFSLFITPITIIMLFKANKTKERKALLLIMLLFLIATCIPFIYKLLQGTLETRWFYMFSIISALIASYMIDDIFVSNKKYNMFFVLCLLTCLLGVFYLYSSSNDLIVSKFKFYVFLALFLIFTTGYVISLKKRSKLLLLVIITIESLFMFANSLYVKGIVEHIKINTVEYREVINEIKENDQGFYRVQFSQGMLNNNASLDTYNYILANLPYSYDVMGTSGYSSLYSFDQDIYLSRYKEDWTFYQTEGRIFVNQFESVKYWIANKDELPPFGFYFYKVINDKIIYKNKYYIELGYYNDRIIDESVLSGLSILDQDMLLVDYATIENSINKN
ncbi:MAG: YfhO family protein, partial [Erysipelotrichales bacterium]|nr:YfhO family protein [Erysipelotrichales bacterium]